MPPATWTRPGTGPLPRPVSTSIPSIALPSTSTASRRSSTTGDCQHGGQAAFRSPRGPTTSTRIAALAMTSHRPWPACVTRRATRVLHPDGELPPVRWWLASSGCGGSFTSGARRTSPPDGRVHHPRQDPGAVERLRTPRNDSVFEERGEVDVKGKGVMRDLVPAGPQAAPEPAPTAKRSGDIR